MHNWFRHSSREFNIFNNEVILSSLLSARSQMEPGASWILWPSGVAQGVALVEGSLSLRCRGAWIRKAPKRGAGSQRRTLLDHKPDRNCRSLCHLCCRCCCICIPALVPHGKGRIAVRATTCKLYCCMQYIYIYIVVYVVYMIVHSLPLNGIK